MPGLTVACVMNPGVFRFRDKTWLLARVAERPVQKTGRTCVPIMDPSGKIEILDFEHSDPRLDRSDPRVLRFDGRDYLTTLSHLRLFCSENGVDFREESAYPPILGTGESETYGIEDCRVVQIDGAYYLTYTQVSSHGVCVGLRRTTDWKNIVAPLTILPAHNKDCAIFPDRIGGKFYALHRPSSPEIGGNYIWIAESLDLLHWGGHRCIAPTRPKRWDSARVARERLRFERHLAGSKFIMGPMTTIAIVSAPFCSI